MHNYVFNFDPVCRRSGGGSGGGGGGSGRHEHEVDKAHEVRWCGGEQPDAEQERGAAEQSAAFCQKIAREAPVRRFRLEVLRKTDARGSRRGRGVHWVTA